MSYVFLPVELELLTERWQPLRLRGEPLSELQKMSMDQDLGAIGPNGSGSRIQCHWTKDIGTNGVFFLSWTMHFLGGSSILK